MKRIGWEAARAAGRAAAVLAFALSACSEAPEPPREGPPVGMVRLGLEDAHRPAWTLAGARPLATTLWYPAAAGVTAKPVRIPADKPIFLGGSAAPGAPPASGPPRPLVLLSHGTGGAAFQMMWLGRRLAAKGYLVAAVDHHGNTAAEAAFDPRGFRMPWERARDVSAVLTQLLDSETWGPRIDTTRIGAAGFSLGGYTMVALAGGVTDPERIRRFCASAARDATCEPQPEYPQARAEFEAMVARDAGLAAAQAQAAADFADPRIRTFALLAPALGYAFTPASLAAIDRPVLILAGAADRTTPAATNARVLARAIEGATLALIQGATHYTFLNECTARGRRFVPVCRNGERSRRAVHEEAARLVEEHFRQVLGRPTD